MMNVFYVALGGAIGASGRYLLGEAAFRITGPGYPWGTFLANVIGGFLMGFLVGWLALKGSQLSGGAHNLRLLFGVGLLGGFTTFSSFSLDAFYMIEKKTYGLAAGYIGASVLFSILALVLGLMIARKVFAL